LTSLVTAPSPPASRTARPGRSTDPLVRPFAWLFLGIAFFLNADVVLGKAGLNIPNTVPLAVGVACIGISFLVRHDGPVALPPSVVALVTMMFLSVTWSSDQQSTILWLRSDGLIMVGLIALIVALPTNEVISVLRNFVRVTLLVTVFAVATDPLARTHIDPLGQAPELSGWHGFFVHKNVMAAFLLIALATVLEFDKNVVTRWASLLAIAVLFAGSSSTTGTSAALVILAVRLWLNVNRRLNSRSSLAWAASTAALVVVAGLAIGASLTAIVTAAGKDLTFTGRTDIWTASWHAIERYPVLGHGVGGLFTSPPTIETAQVLREIGFPAGHPHSGVLDVAVQLGFVGVAVVALLVVSIFRGSFKTLRRSPAIATWALCIISSIVVVSVGESSFLGSSIAIMAMLRILTMREALKAPDGVDMSANARQLF